MADSNKKDLHNLFQRYLRNKSEPGEVRQLLDHFREAENESDLREMILEAMSDPVESGLVQDGDRQAMFDEVHRDIHRTIDRRTSGKQTIYKLWPQVAAAAIILIAAGLLWVSVEPREEPPMHEVRTSFGEQEELTLADGTVVYLNAGSAFFYPERFLPGNRQREVILEDGEAFFDVSRNPEQPFVIKAGATTVQVLGTSFNVKTYSEDQTSRVAVESGQVEVRFGASQIVSLGSGQQAVWDKSEQRVMRSELQIGEIGSWRENQMVFKNERLSAVFRSLERRYDVQIIVERPALIEEQVTFRSHHQSIEAVLEALSFTKQFEYERIRDGDTIIIR